ncbi:hypothetical protein ACFPRL_36400 [Pseudoclavibacter helvolus]
MTCRAGSRLGAVFATNTVELWRSSQLRPSAACGWSVVVVARGCGASRGSITMRESWRPRCSRSEQLRVISVFVTV